MKTQTAVILSSLVISPLANASEYTCKNVNFEEVTLSMSPLPVKAITVKSKHYGSENCTFDANYAPRGQKYLGSNKFNCPTQTFNAEGSISIIVSKEVLGNANQGFIQVRNNDDTFASYWFSCTLSQ